MGNFSEPMVWATKAWDWVKLQSKLLLDWENFGESGYINAEHESDFRLKIDSGLVYLESDLEYEYGITALDTPEVYNDQS